MKQKKVPETCVPSARQSDSLRDASRDFPYEKTLTANLNTRKVSPDMRGPSRPNKIKVVYTAPKVNEVQWTTLREKNEEMSRRQFHHFPGKAHRAEGSLNLQQYSSVQSLARLARLRSMGKSQDAGASSVYYSRIKPHAKAVIKMTTGSSAKKSH